MTGAGLALLAVVGHLTGATPYRLHCDYAAWHQQALAQPVYHGEPADLWLRPWICRSLSRCGWTARKAAALLIVTHENVHLAGVTDEHLTECRAIGLIPTLVRLLHAPAVVVRWCLKFHRHLLYRYPQTYGPAC